MRIKSLPRISLDQDMLGFNCCEINNEDYSGDSLMMSLDSSLQKEAHSQDACEILIVSSCCSVFDSPEVSFSMVIVQRRKTKEDHPSESRVSFPSEIFSRKKDNRLLTYKLSPFCPIELSISKTRTTLKEPKFQILFSINFSSSSSSVSKVKPETRYQQHHQEDKRDDERVIRSL